MRSRFATVVVVALSMVGLLFAAQARAAAEIHRFNVVLSANPTSVDGGDFNKFIDFINKTALEPNGNEAIKHVDFTWAFDIEGRYFVRPNFAVDAGVSQIRAVQNKEYLPAIGQSYNIKAQVITVPVHVGAAYYMQPYNQGDFQARAFLGAGLEQYTYTRATFETIALGPSVPISNNNKVSVTQDSPGYYLEGGAHMFFASHYSVLLSVLYRKGTLRMAQYDQITQSREDVPLPNTPSYAQNVKGNPYTIDVSGAGVRMAVAIGF